jgi:hypothetical protein
VTIRESAPTPTIKTHSRLAQTEPWEPSSPILTEKIDDSSKELQTLMEGKVEALERKYQFIIEQKNTQIQQLMQEVRKKYFGKKNFFRDFIFRLMHNKRHLEIKWKNIQLWKIGIEMR